MEGDVSSEHPIFIKIGVTGRGTQYQITRYKPDKPDN